jgi:hypothetical protein
MRILAYPSFAPPAIAATPVLAALLAGCAAGMTSADCAGADWTALGFADGQSGERAKMFEARARDCSTGPAPDLAAYQAGRARGLEAYCTPQGAFDAGKAGEDYRGVCPREAEIAFMISFEQGSTLHMLTEAKEAAASDYDSAVADLDQHRYLLGVSEKRLLKPSISNEDRELERQDAEFHRREISRLETNLPEMLAAMEKTRTALAGYEKELADKGVEF